MMNQTLIIAHRGISSIAPENTLPALTQVIERKLPALACDVQLSKDDIPILIHDETLDRTSTGTGYVRDYTLEELEAFDFGIKFDKKYTGLSIPSLEEFFQLVKEKQYTGGIHVELKNDLLDYPGLEEIVLEFIEVYDLEKQVCISSFNFDSLKLVREISATLPIALLYHGHDAIDTSLVKDLDAYSVNLYYKMITPELLQRLHRENIRVFCWTVNQEAELQRLIAMGVDGIVTDVPDIALKLL